MTMSGANGELRSETGMGDAMYVPNGTGVAVASLGALWGAYNRGLWNCCQSDWKVSAAELGSGATALITSSSIIYRLPATDINYKGTR